MLVTGKSTAETETRTNKNRSCGGGARIGDGITEEHKQNRQDAK
jgi:hypothetical protein